METHAEVSAKGCRKNRQGGAGLNLEPLRTSIGLLDRARDRGRILLPLNGL